MGQAGVDLITLASFASILAGCGSEPSKSQAPEIIQRDVKEDGSCTLTVKNVVDSGWFLLPAPVDSAR